MPTLERRRRAYLLARDILELAPELRRQAVEQQCAGDGALILEVWDLLHSADHGDGFLESSPVRSAMMGHSALPSGSRAGPYRILREIGRGGMGRVFLAERDDQQFSKKVALKLVHGLATGEMRDRFRRERQILANLEHAGIARLLDGGETTDGVPYLVMEYVEGEPLASYCATRKLGAAQRIRLFVELCHAVEYAHKNLIVHRDLKPSNVLVPADGKPKLLDFGIAKLLDEAAAAAHDRTATGASLLTPAYASPEQVGGGLVTTASDIYSLGVLLFELLTGRLPYEVKGLPLIEALQVVGRCDPAPASKFDPQLKGDVTAVLARALEKDPARRYSSVQDFRRDLEHHLEGRPVQARRSTWLYRTGKFVRRHRWAVALTTVVLIAGGGASIATTMERHRADRNAAAVREMGNRLLSGYVDSLGDLAGSLAIRSQLASDVSAFLDRVGGGDLSKSPALAREVANAYGRLADVQGAGWQNLGDQVAAGRSIGRAIAIRETLLKQNPSDPKMSAELAIDLVRQETVQVRGQDERMRATAQRAIAIFESLPPEWAQDPGVMEFQALAWNGLAYSYARVHDMDHAIQVARKALALCERIERVDKALYGAAIRTVHARLRLADFLSYVGAFRESAQLGESSIAALRPGAPGEAEATQGQRRQARYELACANIIVGKSAHGMMDLVKADAAFTESVHLFEALLAEDPGEARTISELVDALVQHGIVLRSLKREWPARASIRRMIAIMSTRLASTPAGQAAEPAMVGYWRDGVERVLQPLTPQDERLLEEALAKVGHRSGPEWDSWTRVTAEALAGSAQRRGDAARAARFHGIVAGATPQG